MLRFLIFCAIFANLHAYHHGYGRKGYSVPAPAPKYEEPPSYYEEPSKSSMINYATLPVQSSRTLQYIDVPASSSAYGGARSGAPLNIAIPAAGQPINFMLHSRSSPLNIQSFHESSKGSYGESRSLDAAHVRVHTVTRPVIQEIREIITPYRRVQQQLQPVQEMSETYVAREGQAQYQQPQRYPAPAPAPMPANSRKPTYKKPAPAPAPAANRKMTYQKPAPAAPAPPAYTKPMYRKPTPAAPARSAYTKTTYQKPSAPAIQALPPNLRATYQKPAPPVTAYQKAAYQMPIPQSPARTYRKRSAYQQKPQMYGKPKSASYRGVKSTPQKRIPIVKSVPNY